MCVWQSIECRRCEGKVERVIGVSRETGSDVCLGRVGDRPHNLVVKVRQVHSLTHNKSKTVDIPSGILYKQDRLQVMTTDTTFARIYARIFHGHQSVQSRQGRGESLRIRRLQKEGAQGTAGSKAVQGYGHTVRTSPDCNPLSGLDVIGHAPLLSVPANQCGSRQQQPKKNKKTINNQNIQAFALVCYTSVLRYVFCSRGKETL